MDKTTGLEYDLLTGLYTRWYARIVLQEILQKKEFRVFCSIDIDGFSAINDRFGSEIGDALLKTVADVIRKTYEGEMVFHFAGDEFCVLINPFSYSRYHMSMMTQLFFKNLHQIRVEGLDDVTLSFSIGSVFVDPALYHSLDDVYRQATIYRREAKKHEGNFLYSNYGSIPDIEGAFLSLREDRARYNNLSNRLFSISDEETWMTYVNEGAQLKERMFKRNEGHLRDIFRYYEGEGLPDEDYDMLFSLVINYSDALDAFMFVNLIDDILLPHYEKLDKEGNLRHNYLGHLYLLLADNLISVMRMGDRSQDPRIKELLYKTIAICRGLPHDCVAFEPYYLALCEILGHYETIDMHIITREECDFFYEELRQLSLGPEPFKIVDENVSRYYNYLIQNAKLFPLFRACFLLLKDEGRTAAENDELQYRLDYIRAHLVDGVYDMVASDIEYATLARFLQNMTLVEISYAEMLRRLILALNAVHKLEYGRLSESNLIIVAYFFLASAISLLKADIPFEQKLSISRRGLDFLIELLRQRETIASDTQLLFMTQVMLNEMMNSPILSPIDKAFYLEQVLAAVSLDTYSHCKIVGKYANVILSNIIDHHPELLVGPGRPYENVEDVHANRQELLAFMDYACMLHDIGKIIIVPITSNSYRKLSEKEFALIQNHPEGGSRILRHDPAFMQFIPFVRMHHRWWNREGGYPKARQVEAHTNLKILVDILSVCDTLEAATSHIGRNYRRSKTFMQIMDELYDDSGTRYSREVLQSVISSVDTYYTLHQMIDHKWQANYQAIFQEVVTHGPSAFHDIHRGSLPDIYAHKASPMPVSLMQLSEEERQLCIRSLVQMFEIALYTDLTLEHVTLLKASVTVQHDMGQVTSTRDFIQYTRNKLVDPESKPAFDAFIDVTTLPERLKGKPSISLEYRSRLSGWLLARIIPARYDKKGNLTHVIFVAEVAEAEHEKHARLTHAASFDGLTGLFNRSKGEESIRQQIAKGGAQIFAILDCDHFKHINDHLSHLVGDDVLREQSRIMKEVFAGFTIMRLGGDEFVVYLNGEEAHRLIYSVNGVPQLFNRFAERIHDVRIRELGSVAPTMSCGVVYCNDSVETTFELLYDHADRALRLSKVRRNGAITINEISYNEFY